MSALQNYFKTQYIIARNLEDIGAVVRQTISHGNTTQDREFKYVVSTFRVDYDSKVFYIDFRNAQDVNDNTYTVPSSVVLYSGLPNLTELFKAHFNMDFGSGFNPSVIETISLDICSHIKGETV